MGTGEEDEEGDEEDREENVIISDGGSVSFYCIYLNTGYICVCVILVYFDSCFWLSEDKACVCYHVVVALNWSSSVSLPALHITRDSKQA